MLVSFELTMPSNNSWNGRWTGEHKMYVRVRNVGTAKLAREKWEKLIGRYSYNFGDGWVACVTVRETTSSAAARLRKDSAGFCGYEWMIDSISRHGKILADEPVTAVSDD